MAAKGRRGGARQRRLDGRVAKGALGPIDRETTFNLLEALAPNTPMERKARALTIFVKGIEVHRENAPDGRVLSGTVKVQASRRALQKLEKSVAASGVPQFNSYARLRGRTYGAADDGLYLIDGPLPGNQDAFEEFEKPIADALRTESTLNQLRAGIRSVNRNIPFSLFPKSGDDDRARTAADCLLDAIAHPRDWDAELAGYVYLAITRGLRISANMAWHDPDEPDSTPKRRAETWNYGRLLTLAAAQAGMPCPTSRGGMEGLMRRGRACAEEMLKPAITFPDGRKQSHFDIEFPAD